MKYSFSGRAALVTGAGSGIGEAIARLLASNGLSVVVSDVSADNAQRVTSLINAEGGHADILAVPDLESGNMLAKQLEYLGGATGSGLVLGARVPIALTSRADARDTRLASCAVAVLLAHHYQKAPL